MIDEDLIKSVISVVHGPENPCSDASRYSVSNRNIIDVSIKSESVQEEWYKPLVEFYNQQQIFRWVRNHLNLPSAIV